MKLDFLSEKEIKAIDEICELQGLTRLQVIKQSLRTYQAIVKGHSKLMPVFKDKIPKKFPISP